MARHPQRRQDVVDEAVAGVDARREESRPRLAVDPETGTRRFHRPLQQDRVVVEWVGERSRRLDPAQPVAFERQRSQRRRGDAEGMDRRAHVMDESGVGEVGAAGATARRRLALDDEHAPPGAGDRDRRDEPVRPRSDDDGVVLGEQITGVGPARPETARPARPVNRARRRARRRVAGRRRPRRGSGRTHPRG